METRNAPTTYVLAVRCAHTNVTWSLFEDAAALRRYVMTYKNNQLKGIAAQVERDPEPRQYSKGGTFGDNSWRWLRVGS